MLNRKIGLDGAVIKQSPLVRWNEGMLDFGMDASDCYGLKIFTIPQLRGNVQSAASSSRAGLGLLFLGQFCDCLLVALGRLLQSLKECLLSFFLG
jgi:hypothetical protein